MASPAVSNKTDSKRSDAKHAVDETKDQAKKTADQAGEQVKGAIDQAAEGAEMAMQKGQQMAQAAEGTVNDTMHQVGDYLKNEDLRGMADDFTKLIRQYPMASLMVAFGLGLLLASRR